MAKNIFSAIIFFVLTGFALQAQVSRTQWKLSTKKVSDCEYDLIFTVTIEKGWHTFSVVQLKGTEGEVFPTQIMFRPAKGYTLVGPVSETKPSPQYDETISKTVYVHFNKVVYTQRVRLNAEGKVKISGTYENQVCNDQKCETPPSDKFDFDLVGTGACLKK
ncbi:MAG: Protein-disulfide reductase [Bacteroidetes bacterium]|nr:Protein-disulfide reductase [Bacteroidota bacterium]